MHTGMMWFDNSSSPELDLRIQLAADYYRRKFRREPNLCLVNPAALARGSMQVGRITVRAYRPILPHHLWIGVEDRD